MAMPTKSEIVATRATPARKALYSEQAARDGMRLAEWLRWLAERRVREAVRPADHFPPTS
jgi:uncharacterized protein YqcC (DUF446 family)